MGILDHWFQKIIIDKKSITIKPIHVAIIMDGNGRWANKRGLPRTAGHQAGMERIRDVVQICLEFGVEYLTLYAFSTENWLRPTDEVQFLMNLFEKALRMEVEKLHQQKVKIRFIGLKQNLSSSLVELIAQSETLTANNHALTLNIAINYGGRSEIITAVKELIRETQQNGLDPEQLSEDDLAGHLFTAGQPEPDLLIRPGGEFRISNFLIWQLAYTELYFTDLYWPDFGKDEMIKAFHFFGSRERRFGRISRG